MQQAQAAAPLRLAVVTDKQVYRAGERVEVSLLVHNDSKKTYSLCRVQWDGGMTAEAGVKIFHQGKEIQVTGGTSSNPLAQVMVSNEVTSDRFDYLPPGGYANVFWINFTSELQDLDPRPRTKGTLEERKVEVTPLKPGDYEVRGYYAFSKPSRIGMGGPNDKYEFTPAAKRLFDIAFKGNLRAIGKFRVEP